MKILKVLALLASVAVLTWALWAAVDPVGANASLEWLLGRR